MDATSSFDFYQLLYGTNPANNIYKLQLISFSKYYYLEPSGLSWFLPTSWVGPGVVSSSQVFILASWLLPAIKHSAGLDYCSGTEYTMGSMLE